MIQKIFRINQLLLTQKKKHFLRILKIFFLSYHNYKFKSKYGFLIKLDFSKDVDLRFYLNDFETENLLLFNNLINKGSIILDVGANIGIYSITAAKKAGLSGKVFAFEPSDWAFERLKANLKINNLESVIINNFAISEFNGDTILYQCEDDAYNSLGSKPMKEVINSKTIKVVTLDEFCGQHKIEKVDILKIDTEGADYLVLKGAQKLLSGNTAPIVFCEYNRYTCAGNDFKLEDMLNLLFSYGYIIFEIKNSKLISFQAETSHSDELICLKPAHFSLIPISIDR